MTLGSRRPVTGLRTLGATVDRLRLAYTQDAAGKGWDRRWHLVAFAVPEANALPVTPSETVSSVGGAVIQNGLYVSPHGWKDDIRAEAEHLGIAEHVSFASTDDLEVNGIRDPRELARRLWALDDVALGTAGSSILYQDVPEELEAMRQRHERLHEADFLPGALLIGLKYNDCFERDPLLPPELLPRPWPGRAARDLLQRSRRLGILIREDHGQPVLFSLFDEV